MALVVLLSTLVWVVYSNQKYEEEHRRKMLLLEQRIDLCNTQIIQLLQEEKLEMLEVMQKFSQAIECLENGKEVNTKH